MRLKQYSHRVPLIGKLGHPCIVRSLEGLPVVSNGRETVGLGTDQIAVAGQAHDPILQGKPVRDWKIGGPRAEGGVRRLLSGPCAPIKDEAGFAGPYSGAAA